MLDTSLSCAWCFADEASAESWALLEGLEGAQAQVHSLWLWGVGNVLVQAERKGRTTPAAIRTFLGLLETLPIRIDQVTRATAGMTPLPWPAAIASPPTTPPTSSWPCGLGFLWQAGIRR